MGVLEKYKRKTGKMKKMKRSYVTVVYIFDMNFELVI